MAQSQNEWPVMENRPPYSVVPYIEPEVKLAVRPGDVAVVLLEVARRWHNEVEPLDAPGPKDEWGWAYRPVRGQTDGYSNHASATAIDLNATRHPRGAPTADTLTDQQIARCRAIRASMHDEGWGGSVVRWGGDYRHAKPDAMHWEIVGDAPAVSRVAARVRNKWMELEDEDMAAVLDDAALAKIADAVYNRQHRVMKYVDGLYEETDDSQTLGESAQHGAAQSFAARETAEEALAEVKALRTEVAALVALVKEGSTK